MQCNPVICSDLLQLADYLLISAVHAPSFAAKKARIGAISEATKKANSPKSAAKSSTSIKSVLKPPKVLDSSQKQKARKRKSAADFIRQDGQSSDEGWDDVNEGDKKKSKKKKKKSGKASDAEQQKKNSKSNDADEDLPTTPSASETVPAVTSDFVSPARNSVKSVRELFDLEDRLRSTSSPPPGYAEDGDEDEANENGSAGPPDREALLQGFMSDSEHSENSEDSNLGPSPGEIPSWELPRAPVPAAATPQKPSTSATKSKPSSSDAEKVPGTIWLNRIPHGFYEHQLRHYFSQFGPITRLRLSRNKRTGASKHYAFIEFAAKSVADIAARTMNNYLLYGHLLKCELVSDERLAAMDHEGGLWRGANRRFRAVPRNMLERKALAEPKDEDVWEKKVERERKKRERLGERLKRMGYEFEVPEVLGVETMGGRGKGSKDAEGDAAGAEGETVGGEPPMKQITAQANGNGDLEIDETMRTVGKKVQNEAKGDGSKDGAGGPVLEGVAA